MELALRLAGIPARTVAHVERDAYAAATLVARMEEAHLDRAPIWSDLTTFDGGAFRGRVDLVTAGFPCQPFSSAGQRLGVDDDRWLWPAVWQCVRDMGPRFLFLENVPQLVRHGLPHVLADLAQDGWDAEWGLLTASAVGAPHKRERLWLLADADGTRPEGTGVRQHEPAQRGILLADADADDGRQQRLGRQPLDDGDARCDPDRRSTPRPDLGTAWPPARDDRDGWARYIAQGGPEPAVRRSTDGRPPELADALHLGGNGLVPAVAANALLVLADRLGVDLMGAAS